MATGAAAYKSNNPISLDDIANLFEVDSQQDWKPENGFGVEEYINAIHPKIEGKKRQGRVTFMQRVGDGEDGKGEWKTTFCQTENAAVEARKFLSRGGGRDLYVSMSTFRANRENSEVCAIESAYLDLDYHKTKLMGRDPEAVAKNVIRDLEDAKKPLPSFILSTGRGLLCVWLHEMLGKSVMSKWNAVQKELSKPLMAYNPDKGATDAARIFRIVGSINSKADYGRERVRLVWGDPANLHRYKFDDLATAWLPFTKAELISLAEQRALKNAGKAKKPKKAAGSLANGLWGTRLEDITNLIKHRYPSGIVPVGMQDKFLFIIVCALSHTTHPDAILPVIQQKAAQLSGGTWSEKSTSSAMGTAYRRAVAALKGETIEFDGKQVDIRYRFRSSTIIDWLDISDEEMRDAGLRDLCSADIKAERSAARARAFRVENKGQKVSHEEQRQERLLIGRKAIALRDQAKTISFICASLKRSRAYISQAIKEAQASSPSQSLSSVYICNNRINPTGATHYTPFESRTLDLQGAQEADVIDFPGDDLMDFPGDTTSSGSLSFNSITETLDFIPVTSSKPQGWPSSMRIGTSTGSTRRTA